MSQTSAMVGLIAGACLLLFVKFGYRVWTFAGLASPMEMTEVAFPESFVRFVSTIAWTWYPVIGVITTVGTGLLVQSLSRKPRGSEPAAN